MRKKQVKPNRYARKYMNYSSELLLKALNNVKSNGMPVKKAARSFGVPVTTLRDRVLGYIDPVNFGKDTIFTREEESSIIDYLQARADLGYGMTNIETRALAGEMAYEFGRKKESNPLSKNWLYGFLKRWPKEIATLKPSKLESSRAKNTTPEAVKAYFTNLKTVMQENNLENKPNFIYNLDETGIQPEHRPTNIIGNPNNKPQAITSPKSANTTVIDCVNAAGNAVPPFFIFKGKRWYEELLKGACPGTKGTVSESGWCNSTIFKQYLEEHFLPHVHPSDSRQSILLIYDGHASHKSPETIKFAREKNIILFVLPAHSSHILQPLDVSLYGPFKNYYYSECSRFMHQNMGRTITKYDICSLACKAYLKATTPLSIQNGFRKTGIFPLNSDAITQEKFFPCEAFRESNPIGKVKAIKLGKKAVVDFLKDKYENMCTKKENESEEHYLPKKRKQVRPNASGKVISDDEYLKQLTVYLDSQSQKQETQHLKSTRKPNIEKDQASPKPSTSGLNQVRANETSGIPVETETYSSFSDDENDSYCCVCEKFAPPRQRNFVKFTSWAQCDNCDHWVHLEYCTKEPVVRRHSVFLCPHCK